MGSLHSARIVQRRWKRHRWWGAALVALVVTAGCSGDDDDSTEPSIESTVPETTESPPATTAAPSTAPTTSSTSTVLPSTTMSVEELKAQIAADYQRSWQLRRELTENPTLDGLDVKLAQISAPGSENYTMLEALVTELATLGERVVAGTPDEFRIDVEQVDLVDQTPYREAVVTICYIRNRVRVDATGAPASDFGIVASRSRDHLVLTPGGWLPDGGFEDLWEGLGVTECPPA